jgi:hypothetical protein
MHVFSSTLLRCSRDSGEEGEGGGGLVVERRCCYIVTGRDSDHRILEGALLPKLFVGWKKHG